MKLEGKNIFLTGGLGFLGSALAERLVADNQVTIVDNERRNALRFRSLEGSPNLRIVKGDITRVETYASHLRDQQVVIHCAAMAGVGTYYDSPSRTIEVNLIGTYELLRALRGREIERFVNFSTSEVYGTAATDAREDGPSGVGPVGEPRWTYASSKLAAEHLAFAEMRGEGIPVVSVRPFNIYGPGQVGEGAVRNLLPRAMRGEPLEITGDGSQVRAWCYLDDFVEACLQLATHEGAVGRSFNVGNARAAANMTELAEAIVRVTGSSSEIRYVPHRGVDVKDRTPNTERLEATLGWCPSTSLEDGLRMTMEWLKRMPSSEWA